MSIPNITIVIVNYNSSKYVLDLINSTKHISDVIQEIIVIDNNSKNSDKQQLNKAIPKTKIIFNIENKGFGRAVNQGTRLAKSKYILLLNPDTIISDNSILKLHKLIEGDKLIGACGGQIINPVTNKVALSANNTATFFTGLFEFTNLKKIFPNNKFSRNFWVENFMENNKPKDVTSLCGAFILFRKKLNGKLNLFDERYFMYLEDMQFGVDINKKGYKVVFHPNAKIFHFGGKSNNSKFKTVLKYWYSSRVVYLKTTCPI